MAYTSGTHRTARLIYAILGAQDFAKQSYSYRLEVRVLSENPDISMQLALNRKHRPQPLG